MWYTALYAVSETLKALRHLASHESPAAFCVFEDRSDESHERRKSDRFGRGTTSLIFLVTVQLHHISFSAAGSLLRLLQNGKRIDRIPL